MRILQLANFYHDRSGGLRTAIDAFASGYVAAGHEVFVVVPADRRGVREIDGKTVITLRSPRLPAASDYRTIVDQRAVSALVGALRPDVIELSDRTTLARIVVNLPRRPPVVLYSHERLDLAAARVAPSLLRPTRLVNAWTKRLAARVDTIVCASDFAAAEFEQLTPSCIRRVPLGVDLETFCPVAHDEPPLSATLGWSAGAHHRAVYVGRLSPEKHPHDAVAAVARLVRSGRFTELLVVGDGPQREELALSSRGLPVRFIGHVDDRAMIAALLRRADVAIVPSPNETFGLACLEAMACGTPVATVRGGAVHELVTAGSGAVAGPGIDGLASAIASVFQGSRSLQRVEARSRAEEFPWRRSVDAMLDIHAHAVHSQEFAAAG
ncbi:MAG TPA: glycosyltransferase [Ilumatobacteraceae bacterium]|nr:glycosyltransferase [Ilumatobacteraceae bacterium]